MFVEYFIDTASRQESLIQSFDEDEFEDNQGMYYAQNEIDETDELQEITQSIYTLFCDIISIDLKKLSEDLYAIPQDINYDPFSTNSKFELGGSIFRRLYQEHNFLVCANIVNRIFTRLDMKYNATACLKDLAEKGDNSFLIRAYLKSDCAENHLDTNEYIEYQTRHYRDKLIGYCDDYRDVMSAFSTVVNFRNYANAIIDGNEQLYDFSALLKFVQHYESGNFPSEFLKSEERLSPEENKNRYDRDDNGFILTQLDFDVFLKEISCNTTQRSYCCHSLSELLTASIVNIIEDRLSIKKCQHCGKYFIAFNRSDTKYCERPSKENNEKTCREYASYINYLDKNKSDVATKLYRSIYNSLGNKYRRSNNEKLNEKIKKFQRENRKWKNEVKLGTKTETEYVGWLKSVKEKGSYDA